MSELFISRDVQSLPSITLLDYLQLDEVDADLKLAARLELLERLEPGVTGEARRLRALNKTPAEPQSASASPER